MECETIYKIDKFCSIPMGSRFENWKIKITSRERGKNVIADDFNFL